MPACEAKLTELKGEIDNPIIMSGDFNISVSRQNEKTRKVSVKAQTI